MSKTIALVLIATAMMAAPTMAATCSGSFNLGDEWYEEARINERNEMLLRGIGVDVISTEIWGGCIRAWVRTADGRAEMQLYDPVHLRRVD